jgi:hypothetical protein
MDSAGCEPTNLSTKGQQATSRPPKPLTPNIKCDKSFNSIKTVTPTLTLFKTIAEQQAPQLKSVLLRINYSLPSVQIQLVASDLWEFLTNFFNHNEIQTPSIRFSFLDVFSWHWKRRHIMKALRWLPTAFWGGEIPRKKKKRKLRT